MMRTASKARISQLVVVFITFLIVFSGPVGVAFAQQDGTINTETETGQQTQNTESVERGGDLSLFCAKYDESGQRVYAGEDGFEDAEYREAVYFMQRIITALVAFSFIGGSIQVVRMSALSVISSGDGGGSSYADKRRRTLFAMGIVIGLPSLLKILFDYILNQNIMCFIPEIL